MPGLIEKIPYLQDLGITAVELLPVFAVRRAGCAAGLRQLLGLPAGLVLRAAPGLQLAAGSARRARRVPRHGQGAAPRRHRGDPRRRLQPHRRRRRTTARRSASAGSTTTPTTSSTSDRSRYADYTGCGNTLNANQPIVRRMILDSLRYWVDRDARRRLPLRSGVDPVARRDGPADGRRRRCSGTSSRIRCSPTSS